MHRSLFDGSFVVKGDAWKSATAMIAAMDAERPALRLTLGSTAYPTISAARAAQLAALEAQKDMAASADTNT